MGRWEQKKGEERNSTTDQLDRNGKPQAGIGKIAVVGSPTWGTNGMSPVLCDSFYSCQGSNAVYTVSIRPDRRRSTTFSINQISVAYTLNGLPV